ncbi:hypothetical protein MRX96_049761 [Rhipicephalus microplus]
MAFLRRFRLVFNLEFSSERLDELEGVFETALVPEVCHVDVEVQPGKISPQLRLLDVLDLRKQHTSAVNLSATIDAEDSEKAGLVNLGQCPISTVAAEIGRRRAAD